MPSPRLDKVWALRQAAEQPVLQASTGFLVGLLGSQYGLLYRGDCLAHLLTMLPGIADIDSRFVLASRPH